MRPETPARMLALIFFCLFGLRPIAAQEASAPSLPDAWELQAENLTRLGMRFWRVPGCAVAVVHDGKVIWAKGFGTTALGGDQPVTPDTLFPVASITKSFTTTRMAQLVDAGKVGWDDPIVRHLPWFQLSDPLATRSVTLRNAASHSGGLASHDLLWYRWGGTMRDRVERLKTIPVQSKPGEKFAYQTSLFTCLGLVEEAVEGKPWAEQVQGALIDPLAMRSTWSDPAKIPPQIVRAQPHRLDQEDLPQACDPYPLTSPDPAGSIHSTANDLARWVLFHLGDGTTPEGKRLVSSDQMRLLHTQQVAQEFTPVLRGLNPSSQSMGYALGFTVYDHRGEKVLAHGGAVDGMRAQITLVPGKKLGFVVLCNLSLTRMNLSLTHHLVDLFLGHTGRDYNGLVLKQQKRGLEELLERARVAGNRARSRMDKIDPARMEGIYVHPAYGEAKLFLRDGVPMFSLGGTETTLQPMGPGCWLAQADPFGGAVIEFIPGDPPVVKLTGDVGLTLTRKNQP
ncbi:MAG: serine hydrolase domain-containing protein [Gemmataceae bacterium]